jgi:hypothetical protein
MTGKRNYWTRHGRRKRHTGVFRRHFLDLHRGKLIRKGLRHYWGNAAELTFFSVCLFALTAIGGGAVFRRMTHLSQEVPQGLLLGVVERG